MVADPPAPLNSEKFESLFELSKPDARPDIPERLVALGYALKRLAVLELTEAGKRRVTPGNGRTHFPNGIGTGSICNVGNQTLMIGWLGRGT